MDLQEIFPKNILPKRIVRSITLSYRLYRHISETERKLFDEYSKTYPSDIWALAIVLAKREKRPLKKRHFRLAKKYYPQLLRDTNQWNQDYISGINYSIPDQYLEKELLFRGFKPMGKYLVQHSKYGYLATNRRVSGNYYYYDKKYYIYPKPGKLQMGNAFHQAHSQIGFGNLIRLVYPK